jgi:uncharacterized protein (DUF1330 family)
MMMTAVVIFHSKVHDSEHFAQYGAAVGPTLEPYGGQVALPGRAASTLAGDHDYGFVGVLEFPDRTSAEAWYRSSAYQTLTPMRDEAATVVAACYDTL